MKKALWTILLLACSTCTAHAQSCPSAPVQIQILNSGGPSLTDAGAASAILIWINDRPRLLIDAGPGTAARLAQVGADLAEIDAVLFTHLRAERTGDLPALLQLAAATPRTRPLPIYGPAGNRSMPSTVNFVRTLFDSTRGAWRHLGDFLSPLNRGNYKLEPHDVRPPLPKLRVPRENRVQVLAGPSSDRLRTSAISVVRAQLPTLVWQVETQGKRIVVSSDAGARTKDELLEKFAHAADVLVVPQTALEATETPARDGDIVPTTIGRLARATAAKQLVIAPRTRATQGHESETAALIRPLYSGTVTLANDLDCVAP